MSSLLSIDEAKTIMGDCFVGPDELSGIDKMHFNMKTNIPPIPFSYDEVLERKDEYFLILGRDRFLDGSKVTIRNMIKIFGKNPELSEPCFYNQDWYEKESFIDTPLKNEWFFVRKKVYDNSRAVQPDDLIKIYSFPNAVNCTYAFFAVYLYTREKLWNHDFIWCRDLDHNGDRIYVGKYTDVDGINKNGFNIHRHLSLRTCYGCID